MFGKAIMRMVLGAVLSTGIGLAGCNQVPVTKRHALNLVDDQALAAESGKAFAAMKKKYHVSKNPQMNATLQRVCNRLIQQLPYWDQPAGSWDLVVFDDPKTVNALAMPGGHIGVFSGTFSVATTDAQLAVVIGHEIAHVTARHVQERLSQQMLVETGGLGLGVMTGGLTGLGLMKAYDLSAGMVGLSFDRDKESEADHIGLIYMARAGYDPHAAIDLWEKLDQTTVGKKVPG